MGLVFVLSFYISFLLFSFDLSPPFFPRLHRNCRIKLYLTALSSSFLSLAIRPPFHLPIRIGYVQSEKEKENLLAFR